MVHRARLSSTPPLLTTTPRRAAADSPDTRATSAARVSGHIAGRAHKANAEASVFRLRCAAYLIQAGGSCGARPEGLQPEQFHDIYGRIQALIRESGLPWLPR